MNNNLSYCLSTLFGVTVTVLGISQAAALDFGTVIFSDDFEGFSNGQTISAGTNDAPSTGVGLIWQYIGAAGQEYEVTDAQAFGTGMKSLDAVRPFIGITPRYFLYPALVPESVITANSNFGLQYDLFLTPNEFTMEDPYDGLSGMSISIAPGGSPTSAGALLNYGDGGIRAWDTVLGQYTLTGFDFGEGWQTVETTFEVGADLGNGFADTLITHFVTRHSGNSAGELARTQIYQVTEQLLLDDGQGFTNFRADVNNNGQGRFYLDNIQFGRLGSPSIDGDFDGDGDVDGNDFFVWQRGNSPNGIGSGDLGLWQSNYGSPLVANVSAVPEPSAILLGTIACLLGIGTRRSRFSC